MAYSQQNLIKWNPAPFAGIINVWIYRSADSFAAVKAANYISNAFDMGVRVRDIVFVVDTATPATTIANILTCTAAPACTMSQTGVVIAE
jgi:hypothetical protein